MITFLESLAVKNFDKIISVMAGRVNQKTKLEMI